MFWSGGDKSCPDCVVEKLQSYNEKTKEPLEFLPNTFILGVKGDIWLNVEKI
jgi:hypothetical protein